MKRAIFCVLVISLGLLLKSCNTTEPPPPPPNGEKPTLELILEDVSCIEAWIKLKTINLQLPATINLKQYNPTGDSLSQDFILSTQDSLLYIDSFLPNKNYQYKASSIENPATSNELNVTTMDTTSHESIFESWTFGTIGSSRLYDVAIINENNIWAVGEILVADTSINGYTTYNAVHWDGSQWELKRIYYYGSCSAVEYPPLKAIWAFSENNIVITNGGSIGWFDGNTVNLDCRVNPMLTGAINKIWGSSSNDLYVVGNNGNIVHYNGTLWSRIESGTELNIGDIWGIADGNGGYYKYLVTESVLLKIDVNNQLMSIVVEPGMFLNSVWGINNNLIYTADDVVVLYKNYIWEKINRPDVNRIYVIKGQNYNDIYGISAAYTILHFNGYNWANVSSFPNDTYYSMNVLNNLASIAGWQGDKALITVIKRTQ